MIDLALLVAVVEDNAVVFGVVFPDAHLLNAPWQQSGGKIDAEETDVCNYPFNSSVFFSLMHVPRICKLFQGDTNGKLQT